MEGRARRDTELLEGKTMGRQSPEDVSTKQQRIAMLAKQMPGVALTQWHSLGCWETGAL